MKVTIDLDNEIPGLTDIMKQAFNAVLRENAELKERVEALTEAMETAMADMNVLVDVYDED